MTPNRYTRPATRCRMPATLTLAVLAMLLLSGCNSDEDGDGRQTGPVHYELATGTRREYRVTTRMSVITQGRPGESDVSRNETMSRMTIVSPVVHHGQEYALERLENGVIPIGEPESILERNLREDDTGLFGSHWASSDPVSPDERRYAAYPLAPGEEWVFDENVPLLVRAIRREVLTVPAGEFEAWRIDHLPGPNTAFGNTYTEWYGTAGMIRSFGHLEVEQDTQPRSRRITEITWELADYDE